MENSSYNFVSALSRALRNARHRREELNQLFTEDEAELITHNLLNAKAGNWARVVDDPVSGMVNAGRLVRIVEQDWEPEWSGAEGLVFDPDGDFWVEDVDGDAFNESNGGWLSRVCVSAADFTIITADTAQEG